MVLLKKDKTLSMLRSTYQVLRTSENLFRLLYVLRSGEKMRTVRELITPHVDIVIHIGEILQNPEIISHCLMYSCSVKIERDIVNQP